MATMPAMRISHRDRILEQARKSLRKGRWVVPVPAGGKAPRLKDWPDLRIGEQELEQYFEEQDNIGWLLGEPSGGLVDVDLDCPEAIALGPVFLPSTERIHGRASSQTSHYWYTVAPSPSPSKFTDINGECLVEIRSTGQQTLIPPSLHHPTAERLRWESKGPPARVSQLVLRGSVGKLAAGSLLARHWPAEGRRHDAALALAGVLLRGAWSVDDAVQFVGSVARVAGDDEWRERQHDVHTTAKRLNDGGRATGIPSLGTIVGEEVVSKALQWLGLGLSVQVRNVEGPSVTIPSWPDPPDREAFHGLAGEFVAALEPHSEADPVALLAQTLVVLGNVVGRRPHFVAEADQHRTNLFAVMVGATSKGRKGSSLSQVMRAFTGVDPDWVNGNVQTGLSSGEGLVWAVRDPIARKDPVKKSGRVIGYETVIADHGVEDKRLLVLETEFASVLRIMNREGNTLSTTIRHAWDSGNLRILTKNAPAKSTGAHISIIGHITRDELRRYMGSTDLGNGFANRFLWFCARRSKQLPEGGELDAVDFDSLTRRFQAAVEFARTVPEEMKRGNKARRLWLDVYPDLSEGKAGLLGAVTSRGEAQVMRIACIYALLDRSPFIRVEHLRAALALWKYCEASARYIFGDSLGDPVADELLKALRNNPKGLTRTEIRDLFAHNRKAYDIERALGALAEYGRVRRGQDESERGRRSERWYALAGTSVKDNPEQRVR
jgi:hypothetical protein